MLSEQPVNVIDMGFHNKNFVVSLAFILRFKATRKLDCSQSRYFSVGFSRPVCFDGAAAILVCKSERDLGRVSKLPRGAGVGVSTPLPSPR